MNCAGQRRYGGIMTLGPVRWEACEDTPTVLLTIEGQNESQPACPTCWQECLDTDDINVLNSVPILENDNAGTDTDTQ